MRYDNFLLFPDTNTLLHYPSIRDVDWREITSARQVKLVFVLDVIRELDGRKNDPRLGSRAKRALKEINGLRKGELQIREGVDVEVFNREVVISEMGAGSSPDSGDDRIAHLVRQYVNANDVTNFAVYTEDEGMQLRCEAKGIPTIEPDESTRLPSAVSEEQQQIRKLQSDLARFQSAQPSVAVLLSSKQSSSEDRLQIRLSRPARPDIDKLVQDELASIRPKPSPSPSVGGLQIQPLSAMFPMHSIAYAAECDEYMHQFRAYLEDQVRLIDQEHLEIVLQIEISNSGSCPVTELELKLNLPPVFRFISAPDRTSSGQAFRGRGKPSRPADPNIIGGRSQTASFRAIAEQFGSNRPDVFAFRDIPSLPNAPRVCLLGDVETGIDVRVRISKLNHHRSVKVGPFQMIFKDWDMVRPFEVPYTIIAANIVEKHESKIPAIVILEDKA